MQNSMHSIK